MGWTQAPGALPGTWTKPQNECVPGSGGPRLIGLSVSSRTATPGHACIPRGQLVPWQAWGSEGRKGHTQGTRLA